MKTDKTHLLEILKNLREKVDDVEGGALVSRNGMLIVSDLRASTESEVLAAMIAEIGSSSDTVSSEIGIGKPLQVILSSSKGEIIISGAGRKAILVCLVKAKANLGRVLFHMERAVAHMIPFIK